jgi:ribosomal protein S18 acetylase RimI-like enzyme
MRRACGCEIDACAREIDKSIIDAEGSPRVRRKLLDRHLPDRYKISMGDVMVRRATVDDAGDIARVHVRSWQVGYRGLMPDAVLDGLDPAARGVRHRKRLERPEPGSAMFVAVTRAVAGSATRTVVGFAETGHYRDGRDVDDAGEIYAIYVDPAHWGTGAGRALMDVAVAQLTAAALRPVRLWTLDGNERARRFYERYGFVADGAVRSHPIGGGLEVPTLRLTLRPA